MDFSLEDVARHRPADESGGDVVEKGGKNEDDAEEGKAREPAPRQERRHLVGKPARFEMARENGETHQEQEQVRQVHPLLLEVESEPLEAIAGRKAGKGELVENDCGKPGEGGREGMAIEDRDPDKGQREQDEFEGNAKNVDRCAGDGTGHFGHGRSRGEHENAGCRG